MLKKMVVYRCDFHGKIVQFSSQVKKTYQVYISPYVEYILTENKLQVHLHSIE